MSSVVGGVDDGGDCSSEVGGGEVSPSDVALADTDLEPVWTTDLAQAQSVAAVDQSLIVAGGERDQPGFVAKYELATGTLDWRASYVRPVAAPPVFVRDLAIALASDPVLFCD